MPRISQLPDANLPLAGTELVPVVQGGATKHAPASSLGPVGLYVPPGGDAAAAFRLMAASNTRIVVPPGVYTFKSQVSPLSPAIYQASPCVRLAGLTNFHIEAHGAVFLIDNAISGPDAGHLGSGSSHFLIQDDCKNVSIQGGELVGNRTGLPSTTLNNGIAISSGTQVTLRDIKFSGDYSNGSAITATYAFETQIENCWFNNVALPIDIAHCENFTFRDNRCFADQAVTGRTGFKVFWDEPTRTDNVATTPQGALRTLRGGQGNNIQVSGNMFHGYPTGVFVEGVESAQISNNVIRDGVTTDNVNNYAGVTVAGSAAALAAGKATRAISIINNDIFNNGNRGTGAGAGVIMAPAPSGIDGISIKGNRIRDNTTRAIEYLSATGLSGQVVTDNDFLVAGGSPQTEVFDPASLATIGSALVLRDNAGFNPTEIAANRTLPSGTGPTQTVYNENGFACVVYITNTSSTVCFPRYRRQFQPSGDAIAAGGIANGAMVTFYLLPGDGIYFDAALPSFWYWFGV